MASEARFRPIASPKKPGKEYLLRVKMRAGIPGGVLVGHWMPGGHCIEDHPPIAGGWYFWNGCMFDLAAEPIEWMDIPDGVPTETQEERPATSSGPLIGHIRNAIAGANPDDSVETPVWLLTMVADALEKQSSPVPHEAKKASDVLGWMDSEGPVTVAPGRPKDDEACAESKTGRHRWMHSHGGVSCMSCGEIAPVQPEPPVEGEA